MSICTAKLSRNAGEEYSPSLCQTSLQNPCRSKRCLRRIFSSIRVEWAGHCGFIVFPLLPLSFCLFHLKRSRNSALARNPQRACRFVYSKEVPVVGLRQNRPVEHLCFNRRCQYSLVKQQALMRRPHKEATL